MSIRKGINKIISATTETDKGLLIIQYLDDIGLELDSNGWLDDDEEAQDKLYDSNIMSEIERIIS